MDLLRERRQYRRVERELDIRISREVLNKSIKDIEFDIGKSVNMSASGLLVDLNINVKNSIMQQNVPDVPTPVDSKEKSDFSNKLKPLRIEDRIQITFLKPNTFEIFKSSGRVVRVEENSNETYRAGIQFFELSPFEMEKLNYYVVLY
ncbi:MAG: PilZ domain-containing protein [Proteobacteria bacterium]|nr:PilZ domain-containing protein [Pseudomonadota bacterium]